MSKLNFINLLIELVLGHQVDKVDERWRNQPQPTTTPPQTTPPKPPVPIEQQPGPIIQPKRQEPTPPTEEQILAFAKTDPDLQNLVTRYSHTLNNRHTSPLDSMYNPQGQKFLRELSGLVKTRFNV